jgi:hypothetical protein
MSAQALLQDLTSDGLSLSVTDGDRIAVDGPRDALDKWLPEIRAHKAALIACLTTAANDEPARHHSWLVTLPTGERHSSMFCPPLSLAEVQARDPGALVEREPDPAPAPPLSPSALEVVYAWLRHVGETDLKAGQEFIESVARDPGQLRACFEDAVRLGLADRPTAETDQATDIEDASIKATAKATCSRCTHWTPNPVNAAGGIGRCAIEAPASKRVGSLWPGEGVIHCTQYQEASR